MANTEPIVGWGDFAGTSPAAETQRKPDESVNQVSRFGFSIDDAGFPIPINSLTNERIEEIRRNREEPDWRPVSADEVIPGFFHATTDGLERRAVGTQFG